MTPVFPTTPRRILSLLTVAAAVPLATCAAPVPTTQQQAVQKVHDFTSGMDTAIDQADPARLRAASDGRTLPVKSPAPLVINDATTDLADPSPPPPKPLRKPLADLSTTPAAVISPNHMSGVPSLLGTVPAPPPLPESLAPPATQPAATQPAPPSTVAATPAPSTQPTPVPSPAPPPAAPTVEQALAVLQKQAAQHPSLNTSLALSLLTAAQGKAPDPSPALGPADQTILADLLLAFQSMTTPPSADATVPERAAPLVDAIKKWQVASELLTLPKLALASRVDSFGVYTPVEAKFTVGTRHAVIIYCEVANFASKKTDDGWFETRLSQKDTLLTDDKLLIWRPVAEEVEDRSKNQRHDFYLVKKLTIPDNLDIGEYTLRMSVTDKNSGKIATANLPIQIIPAP